MANDETAIDHVAQVRSCFRTAGLLAPTTIFWSRNPLQPHRHFAETNVIAILSRCDAADYGDTLESRRPG